MIIPSPVISKFYGPVNNCLWFELTNEYGIFVFNLETTPNQNFDVNLTLENLVDSGAAEFNLVIPRTASQTPVITTQQVLHDPSVKSPIYVILNTF